MRIVGLVDGFNLYHSLKLCGEQTGIPAKWLDLRAVFSSFLPHIGRDAELGEVYYCTALAHHIAERKPGVVSRHRSYIAALEATGVSILEGRFKEGRTWCKHCRKEHSRWEEKESDVALALRVLEVFHSEQADAVMLVTGDTDLVPAVLTARRLFPGRLIYTVFPYKRKNNELAKASHRSFNLKPATYARCQLPETVELPGGRTVKKPDS